MSKRILFIRHGEQPKQKKIEKITGELHPMLKLGYFFSHRDLDKVLTEYEKGNKFYLYTGRGPSGLIHMGHLLPWIFTKYLQDKFDVNLIFQITDDEKFLYSDEKSFDDISKYTKENILLIYHLPQKGIFHRFYLKH